MSRLDESKRQGTLIYPLNAVQVALGENADLVISLLHHPFNWIQTNNARALRQLIESSSDLIMTGHEHVAQLYSKSKSEDKTNEYVEGAVLQDTESSTSGFNIIMIDLAKKEYQAQEYSWETELFIPKRKQELRPFHRMNTTPKKLEITREFSAFLLDIGAAFTHPSKSTLCLPDVFVYPDMDNLSYHRVKGEQAETPIISGKGVLEYVLLHCQLLIVGGDKAGKTALAKTLFSDLYERGFVPLLISGTELRSGEELSQGWLNAVPGTTTVRE